MAAPLQRLIDEFRRLQQQAETARTAYRDVQRRSNELQERYNLGQADARVMSAASAKVNCCATARTARTSSPT